MPFARPSRRLAATPVRRSLVLAISASLLATAGAVGAATIHLNAGALDTASAEVAALRQVVGPFDGKRLHLVQFQGAIQPEWVDALLADGMQVIGFIPDYAYLVYGDAAALSLLQSRAGRAGSPITWDGAWRDEYKFHPEVFAGPKDLGLPLAERQPAGDRFLLQLVADPSANADTLGLLSALGGSVLSEPGAIPGVANYRIQLPAGALATLASRPEVVSIHRFIEPTLLDERQNMIVAGNITGNVPNTGNYFDLLTAWGFTQAQFNASAFIVDVTDDGADINPPGGIPANAVAGPVLPNHFVLYESGARPIGVPTPTGTSRFRYKGVFATPGSDAGLGNSGHGQLNMSIVGGFVPTGTVSGVNFGALPHSDGSGFRYGFGVAPYVRLANSVIFDPNFRSPNFATMLDANYVAGTRISSNSWGAPNGGAYTASSQTYDRLVRDSVAGTAGNQQMLILFAAGNSGPGPNTTGDPATGKNVITVGAAENVHPFGGADGCGTGDAEADSANDIVGFSSRGPTDDGRVKPEIVAPGTHVTGMAFVTPDSTGNGTAVATYRADGVCGGVGGANNFPAGQAWYTASSGTSHSTPALAGGAALVYQQFINNPPYLANFRTPAGSAPPSPALAKAYLVNSARYMTGASANDTLPSNSQGMGMMNLGRAFDGTPRAIRDQVAGDTFSGSGQVRGFTGTIPDNTKPFRVTLAWTDAPGTTTGNAFVNNLDLIVRAGGNTYLGNAFTGQASSTGGTADTRNNAESVFIPAGVSGPYTVAVRATNVAGDGVPGTGTVTDQDFALVTYNTGAQGSCPTISVDPTSIPTNIVVGTVYPTQTFSATGGATPYTFSNAGTVPPGLTLNGTSLSGTPTTGGSYTFSVLATDANGCPGLRDYSVVVTSANLALGARTLTTGNAILEPNECNDLNIVLNNTGTNAATAVSSTLSTTTPGVTLDTAQSAYPDLVATTGTGTNIVPFRISTEPSVTCGSTVNLTQTITFTGGGSPTVLNFAVPVGVQNGAYTFGAPAATPIDPAAKTLIAGSVGDDQLATVATPFALTVYGTPVAAASNVRVSTNGSIQFVATGGSSSFSNAALPAPTFGAGVPTVMPYWDDLLTSTAGGGIYQSVTGTAPNRVWNLEWRGTLYVPGGGGAGGAPVNFELRFFENQSRFQIVYNNSAGASGAGATIGVQASSTGSAFTQYSFNTAGAVFQGQGMLVTLPPPVCTPTPGTCAALARIFAHGFEPAAP